MFTRLVGALLRATMIVIVILTPSLVMQGTGAQDVQVATLVALAFALIVAFEYGAKHTGLIEFRNAPPFNRIRIVALFLALFGASVINGMNAEASTLTVVISALGYLIGHTMDFPLSPIRVVLDQMPDGVNPAMAMRLQAMTGLSFLIMLISLFIFSALIRLEQWPHRGTAFNLWINLPTFDPSAGGDVAKRLTRDAHINIIFGLCAPFIVPLIAGVGANHLQIKVVGAPQTQVWAVTLWMFLPLSLGMRGLAMLRLARMIRARRARLVANVDADAARVAFPSSPV